MWYNQEGLRYFMRFQFDQTSNIRLITANNYWFKIKHKLSTKIEIFHKKKQYHSLRTKCNVHLKN